MLYRKNIFTGIFVLFFAFMLMQDADCKKQHSQKPARGHSDYRKTTPHKKSSSRIASTKVVKGKVYRVRSGDTLYGIARKHGVAIDDLKSANPGSRHKLTVGMVLKIPRQKASAARTKQFADIEKILNAPRFQWPIKRVVSYRRDGDTGVHPIGLVISGRPDSIVYTSADGVVKKVGQMRGYGRYVVVKHDGKFITVYSNLSEVHVKNGDMVVSGDLIGRVSSENILHFQIDREGKPQNPLLYLPRKG